MNRTVRSTSQLFAKSPREIPPRSPTEFSHRIGDLVRQDSLDRTISYRANRISFLDFNVKIIAEKYTFRRSRYQCSVTPCSTPPPIFMPEDVANSAAITSHVLVATSFF